MAASIAGKISRPEQNQVQSAATGSASILSSLSRQRGICNWANSFLTFRELRHLILCATDTQSPGRRLVLPGRSFRLGRPHAGAAGPGRGNGAAGRHGARGRAASHGPALAYLLAEPGRLRHGDQDRVATAGRRHRGRHPVAGPGEAPGRRPHHLHLYERGRPARAAQARSRFAPRAARPESQRLLAGVRRAMRSRQGRACRRRSTSAPRPSLQRTPPCSTPGKRSSRRAATACPRAPGGRTPPPGTPAPWSWNGTRPRQPAKRTSSRTPARTSKCSRPPREFQPRRAKSACARRSRNWQAIGRGKSPAC